MKDMRRTSLLALPKNPRRNHLRFYCIVTAKHEPNYGLTPYLVRTGCGLHEPGLQPLILVWAGSPMALP